MPAYDDSPPFDDGLPMPVFNPQAVKKAVDTVIQPIKDAIAVVDGVVNGERVRERFGQYLENLGEDGSLDPDAVADAYWFMHTQLRSVWTFEVDVRPFKETW